MPPLPITTRREFIVRGLGLVGVSTVLPNFLIRSALAGPAAGAADRVLVIIQLSGGNDTLSTLVPYNHDAYVKGRRSTRIEEKDVLKLDDKFGFHPNLKGFKELWDEGQLGILPGVGYPNPNYSHFTSMDIWHVADLRGCGPEVPHGWIGRAMDKAFGTTADPKLTVAVGTTTTPPALVGARNAGITFRQPDSFRYNGDRGDKRRAELYEKLHSRPVAAKLDNLAYVTQTAIAANASSEEIRRLAGAYKPQVEYPNSELGKNLSAIAGLIRGGLNTRVYYTFQGGYDTHSNQRGNHDRLLQQLNDAVIAFQRDLAKQGLADRVLTFSFSEFSRNVAENGSNGTDHGHAGAMYFFGPNIKPGLRAEHPSLDDIYKVRNGALKHNVDFRSVYATVLEKWLNVPSEPVLGKYPLVDIVA